MSDVLRNKVINWVRFILQPPNDPVVFLDTETTGLSTQDEIIDISLINNDGEVLYDSLIKPTISIPIEASKIHNISDQLVETAPNWGDILPKIRTALNGKRIGAYNADFDIRMIEQTSKKYGEDLKFKSYYEDVLSGYFCIMKLFSYYYGDWDKSKQDYKWHKLDFARDYFRIELPNTHRAQDDALLSREVLMKIMYSNYIEGELEEISLNNAKGINFIEADLSEKYFSGLDLSGADLSNANLSGTYLDFVDLSRANLENCNLAGSKIYSCKLNNANLKGANLVFSDLDRGSDFSGANCEAVDFSWAHVGVNDFYGTNFKGAKISEFSINNYETKVDNNTILPNGKKILRE